MKHLYHFLVIVSLLSLTSLQSLSQSVPSYVPTNGLVAWWPFSGNAGDSSGNQNHGIVHGATLTADRNGQANSAYLFVPGQWITIPNSPTISVQQNITISIWFYMDGGGCNPRLFQIHQNSNNCGGYAMSTPGTSNVRGLNAYFGSCTSEIYMGMGNQTPIPALSWQHIALTIDGVNGFGKLYWNGQLIQTLSGSPIPVFSYNNNPLTIGNINPGRCDWWGGKIDDFGIWNRALTQQEITNLYNSQLPTQTSLCLPTITTNSPTSVGIDSVVVGGNITNDGGSSIVLRGVCYSTTPNPHMGNTRTEEGSGIGIFSSILRNLSPSTTYYARSYAKNSNGVVVYGNEVSFTTNSNTPAFTCGTSSITDVDGNSYNTVQIGTQCWTQSNLKVSKYRNGDNIPTGLSNSAWQNTTSGAYAIYNNDPVNDGLYGKLYNHYAVMDNRGLCPTGWHVPTDSEWNVMVKYLDPNADTVCGGCWQSGIAGGALKSTATQPTPGGWNPPNTGATNSSGFTAGPGGLRGGDGGFYFLGYDGCWWSSSSSGSDAWKRSLSFGLGGISRDDHYYLPFGRSVRCLRD